jgi:hypothetical protein
MNADPMNRFGRHRVARIRGLTAFGITASPAAEVVGLVTALHVDPTSGDLLMEIDLETPGQAAERVLTEQANRDAVAGC